MRWFRFYDEALNDPKVQNLCGERFKAWVNLLCLASKHGGFLPDRMADIAFALRISEPDAGDLVMEFIALKILDKTKTALCPHNWKKRQYDSDNAAERMRRYRKRKKAVTVTPALRNTVTPALRNGDALDTDTDTEQKEKGIAEAIPKKKTPKTKTVFPESFELNETGRALSAELCFTPGETRAQMCHLRDYAISRDWRMVDWQATARNWLRKAKHYEQNRRSSPGYSTTDGFAQVDAVIDEMRRRENGTCGDDGQADIVVFPRLREGST